VYNEDEVSENNYFLDERQPLHSKEKQQSQIKSINQSINSQTPSHGKAFSLIISTGTVGVSVFNLINLIYTFTLGRNHQTKKGKI
jgi:hypothetical protein